MLKNRAFLIGLGAGIIIGALLFQLMLSGEQSRQNLVQIGNETNEKLYTHDEVDALLKAERNSLQIDEQKKIEARKQAEKPATDSGAVIEDQDEAKPEQAPSKEESNIDQASVKHVIRIEAGSGLAKTAGLLAAQNIIQDQAAFINQMKKSEKLVRAGYFLFQENITVNEAISIVTSQPITKEQADAVTTSNRTK